MRLVAPLLVAAVSLSGACGVIEEPGSQGDPVWQLTVQIASVEAGVDAGRLRVAVTWLTEIDYPREVLGVSEFPVSGDLALTFPVVMHELPPPAFMRPLDEEGRAQGASGQLVIYEDRNGNDQLDLLDLDSPEAIDRVWGPAEIYYLAYLEGTREELAPYEAQPGFVVYQGNPENTDQIINVLGPDHVLSVQLVNDPTLQLAMCRETDHDVVDNDDDTDVDSPADLPVGATIECAEDGESWYWYTTREQTFPEPCHSVLTVGPWDIVIAPFQQPLPEDWPCEVTEP